MHIFTPRTAALLLALAATSAQAATFDYFESFDDESTFTQSTTLPDGWTSLATTQSIQRYKGSMHTPVPTSWEPSHPPPSTATTGPLPA